MTGLGNREKQEIGRCANNLLETYHLPFDDASERRRDSNE